MSSVHNLRWERGTNCSHSLPWLILKSQAGRAPGLGFLEMQNSRTGLAVSKYHSDNAPAEELAP